MSKKEASSDPVVPADPARFTLDHKPGQQPLNLDRLPQTQDPSRDTADGSLRPVISHSSMMIPGAFLKKCRPNDARNAELV